MPKIVPVEQRMAAINLMLNGMGQRDIERETGLCRPFIRKLSREIGHQFERNGIEKKGQRCMCTNCELLFYKPQSRIDRAERQFCSEDCRKAYVKGSNHPMWRTGVTANSFSSWIKNQACYEDFRQKVLIRDGHKCIVSGKTDHLHVHHILHKAEAFSPEKALDPDNAITLNDEVHREIHKLTREGNSFDESIIILKAKYGKPE